MHNEFPSASISHFPARGTLPDALVGAAFGLVPRGGKHPLAHGWKTPPVDRAVAEKHLAAGGNVGIATGAPSDGLLSIDCDVRWPEFLATFPELATSIRVERANAPERGKVLLRVLDDCPRSNRWVEAGAPKPSCELLSTGLGAIIAGTHKTGAQVQLIGDQVVELTLAQLDNIWRTWTRILGREESLLTAQPPIHRSQRIETSTAPRRTVDAALTSYKDQIAAYWTAFGVFHFHGWVNDVTEQGDNWKLHGYGGLFVGDPHKADVAWRWFNHSQQVGGDQFDAWAHCTHRSCDSRTFGTILREMGDAASIEPPPPPPAPPDTTEAIEKWRSLAHTTNWIARDVNVRSVNGVISVLDALLDYAMEQRTLRPIFSTRQLALRAGKGSSSTAQRLLDILATVEVLTLSPGTAGATQCVLHDPDTFALKSISRQLQESPDRFQRESRHTVYSQNRADDPWLSGTSKWAKRTLLRPSSDDPAELREWLRNTAGFGATGLRCLDALVESGGAEAAALAAELHMESPASVRRQLAHMAECGILEVGKLRGPFGRPRNCYVVASDWRTALEEIRPTLRTHLLAAERAARAEQDMIDYLAEREELVHAGIVQETPEATTKRRRRRARAATALAAWLQVLEPTLTPEEASELAQQPSQRRRMIAQKLANTKVAKARVSLAEQRHADQWATTRALLDAVATLRAQGQPKRDWFRQLRLAGFTENEAARGVAGAA